MFDFTDTVLSEDLVGALSHDSEFEDAGHGLDEDDPMLYSVLPDELDEKFQMDMAPCLPYWSLSRVVPAPCDCCTCHHRIISPAANLTIAEVLLMIATVQDEGNIPDNRMEPLFDLAKTLLSFAIPKDGLFNKHATLHSMKQVLGGHMRGGLRFGRKVLYCPGEYPNKAGTKNVRCQTSIPEEVYITDENGASGWPYTCENPRCKMVITTPARAAVRIECNITAQVSQGIRNIGEHVVRACTPFALSTIALARCMHAHAWPCPCGMRRISNVFQTYFLPDSETGPPILQGHEVPRTPPPTRRAA